MKLRVSLGMLLGVLLASAAAWGQDGPPAPPGPGAVGPRDGHGMGRHERGEGRGPQILPPGTWWRNPDMVKMLALTDDQRKRIDDAFLQQRAALTDMHASLEKQQVELEPLLNAQPFDQAKTQAAIGRIADTRAELEKTNAKMLVSIRAVLSQEQWQKLRAQRPGMAGVGGAPRGKIGWAGTAGPQP